MLKSLVIVCCAAYIDMGAVKPLLRGVLAYADRQAGRHASVQEIDRDIGR